MYYNPETREKLDRRQLKALLNMSFPEGEEQVEGWYLLRNGEAPETVYGEHVVPGDIELIDGHYVQTYEVAGVPLPRPQALEDRLTDIENALTAIHDTQTDLEHLSENGVSVSERLSELEDAIVELAELITEVDNG